MHRNYFIIASVALIITATLGVFRVTRSETATLYFTPASGKITASKTFSVSLKLNTSSEYINAGEATVSFPVDKLAVHSISKSGSVFTLWPSDPSFSNKNGTVSLSGGRPSPGYKGSGGTIVTITFTAKAAGTAKLTLSGAQVLANDGNGTNILGAVGSATFTINEEATPTPAAPTTPGTPTAPTITSSANPDQTKWYQAREISASWSAGSGVLGYNAVFDKNTSTVPPEVNEGMASLFRRTALTDGTYYLHVRAYYKSGWSDARHYKFQVDGTAPLDFTVKLTATSATEAQAEFAATDATSGILHYEIKVDSGDFAVAVSPKILTELTSGEHRVTIRASDQAGNTTESFATVTVSGFTAPQAELTAPILRVIGQAGELQTVSFGSPLVIRGAAAATDKIHIIVRSQDSVFDFPVSDIVDPNPVTPPPEGMTAWKVELTPDLSVGEHEIHVTRISSDGLASTEAPVIRFRVIAGAVRVGQIVVPLSAAVRLELGIILALMATAAALLIWIIRLRRHVRRQHSEIERRVRTEVDRQMATLERRIAPKSPKASRTRR